MFGWNVQPPVRSCNLTGNRPKSCLTQMERAGVMQGGGGDGCAERGGEMSGRQDELH